MSPEPNPASTLLSKTVEAMVEDVKLFCLQYDIKKMPSDADLSLYAHEMVQHYLKATDEKDFNKTVYDMVVRASLVATQLIVFAYNTPVAKKDKVPRKRKEVQDDAP